jgi:hypothetical protein
MLARRTPTDQFVAYKLACEIEASGFVKKLYENNAYLWRR